MKDLMTNQSIPGTVIAFSINGTNVWTEGFGYTDVENDVITHKDSIWRLASISKPLTSALIGRLMDKKLIDLNHDIHRYLSPDFYPYKTFNGSAVNITLFSYESWWPSAGIISTASDLIRFGNSMLSAYKGHNKDFLSEETVKELWTPETIGKIKPKDMKDEYAKGWFVTQIAEPYPYRTQIWHAGGLLGTSTMLILFPNQNIVGVAFANKGWTVGLDQLILSVAKNFEEFL
ncbi:unnamed protein product [Medioppia subpectinata]|uniref:Beta-lactamase-related domain-containing protein n=1 Tax=Medioppia subpectinata TaxID=1979941 RepID=A0A7R9PV81_9ACAR|nr:unnamed protein product [Medioppia subpectinata]CAG2102334.1 unnamed protein product [Medioppia subpectinata]